MSDAAEVRALLIARAHARMTAWEERNGDEQPPEVLTLAVQLAEALEAAHAEPDNEREAASLRAEAQELANTPWVDEPIRKFAGRVSKYLATRRSARVPVSRDELAAWLDGDADYVEFGVGYRLASVLQGHWDIYPKADRKPADSSNGDDRGA